MAVITGGGGSFKVKIKDANNRVYYFGTNGDGDLNPIQCHVELTRAITLIGMESDPTTWTTGSNAYLGYDASTSPPRVHGTLTGSTGDPNWSLVIQGGKRYLAYEVGGNLSYVFCNTSNNEFAAFTTDFGNAGPIELVLVMPEE
jgi:hypothetical protein